MGSVFGGYLSRAGHDVTLLDVRRDLVDAIASSGLTIEVDDGRRLTAHPRAIVAGAAPVEADTVIVLTKATATASAAEVIARTITPAANIVTLQNGLGNDAELAAACGASRVFTGTTTVGGELLGPGRVRAATSTSVGRSVTTIGIRQRSCSYDRRLAEVADAFTRAGLPTTVSEDIDIDVWRKVATAATTGSITAVLGLRLSDLLANDEAVRVLRQMVEEIVRVANALGVQIDSTDTWERVRQVLELGGEHLTSMAADVVAGRPTEIDALCGSVSRAAAEKRIATPVLDTVATLVRVLELTYDRRVHASVAG